MPGAYRQVIYGKGADKMGMTKKQQILAAARGEKLEKLPFGARIDLWYKYHAAHGTLPDKYRGWGQIDIIRDLGVGMQYRLFSSLVREKYRDMEVVETDEPPYITTEYRTPVGTVAKKEILDSSEGTSVKYELEKLFKSEKDYPVLKYVIAHTEPEANFEPLQKMSGELGEDGLVIAPVGRSWSPAQRVMREIMGYEVFFYELADRPARVEELIELLNELDRKSHQVTIASGLQIFQVCSNWSDDIHTPVFRKYFVPWFQEVCGFLHDHGCLATAHADGEMRRLNPMFRETGIDIAEAITPAPRRG